MTLRVVGSVQDKKFRDLHKKTDEIFIAACDVKDWTWGELAKAAGLSYSTVAKLGKRETRYPRHMTIWKMAKAVGLNYQLISPAEFKRKAG